MRKRVVVLGGGASGMMAAIAAAGAGAEVFVVEHNDRVGKKLLSTGNGKCNFTNRKMGRAYYHSGNPGFPGKVLEQFGLRDTLDFFQNLGVVPKERNGCIYPAGGQASGMLDILRQELLRQGVTVYCSTKIDTCIPQQHILRKDRRQKSSGFLLKGVGPEGQPFSIAADSLILACGGKAAPASGSDGSGFVLAERLGHSVTPLSPALVQLRCREHFYGQLAGIRAEGRVRLYVSGKKIAEDQGELQLTAYGISGIPVFQVSRFAGLALLRGEPVEAELDFAPSMSAEELKQYFHSFTPERYGGLLNKKLLTVLLKRYGTEPGALATGVKGFRTQVEATNSFEHAQVTAGGVDTRQINPFTMMSRIVSGLFFAGEIMDVDGDCGGYNLQWAWSTGYLAGISAAREDGKAGGERT